LSHKRHRGRGGSKPLRRLENRADNTEFSFLKGNLMVPAGRRLTFHSDSEAMRTAKCKTSKRCIMTELFTMIVLAANIAVAAAFARFAPTAAADTAAASEQSSSADTFEGRVVAKIQTRSLRGAISPGVGESTGAYWGSPLF
jgi:hypothetical protein